MKPLWKQQKLRDIVEIAPRKQQAKEILEETDKVSFVPMDCLNIRQKELAEHQSKEISKVYSGYTYFAEGDVLLAKITPCFENGKIGIASNLTNGIGFGSSEFMVLRPNEILLPEYLYYFLNRQTFRSWASQRMTGAVGHKRVPKELISNLDLPLPPLEEQRRIVAILDEAFEGLETAQANAEANLASAEELFRSHLKVTFPNALGANQNAMRANWELKPLVDVCEFKNGFAFKSKKFTTDGTPVVRIGDIKDGGVMLDKTVFACQANHDEDLEKYEVLPGDLLIAMSGATTGKVGLNTTRKTLYQNQRVGRFIPKKDLEKRYLFYFLLTKTSQNLSISKGSAQPNLSTVQIQETPIPLPPLEEQRRIVAILDNFQFQTDCLKKDMNYKISQTCELKQSLLQKAFAGELT